MRKEKRKRLFKMKVKRMERGLTQAQLAKKIGLAPITIFQYEAGWRVPKMETLEKIAVALDCEVKDIL
ncbi:MAG: helix-turn-helix transcriptional regulator [Clostridia bacterium]|nr:helix-turn-helix transcriptional regulator [Clostridia bacterium]